MLKYMCKVRMIIAVDDTFYKVVRCDVLSVIIHLATMQILFL